MKSRSKSRSKSPWPTVDTYRLALLGELQNAERVDLTDFFRQVYPEIVPSSAPADPPVAEPIAAGAEAKEVSGG